MAKDETRKGEQRAPAPTGGDAATHDPAIAERLQALTERSQRVWLKSLDRAVDDMATLRPDPLNATPAMARLAYSYAEHPQRMAEAAVSYWSSQADLWLRTWQRAMGGEVAPAVPPRKDKRFKNEAWEKNPVLDYMKQSYLLTADWMMERVRQADDLSPKDRKKLDLVVRSFIAAHAPNNYPGLNPDVLEATIEEGGQNLLRGLEHLMRDIEQGGGVLRIRQTDLDAFHVGGNLANTPGSVIFENEVMQLIQYAPQTEQVYEKPLLIVPPWINKFYVLDLNEKKSMVRWLTAQGYTVFLISWVNPTEKEAGETWAGYMQKGVLTALDCALAETGAAKANIVGYCIGGTMLGTTLAYMAETDDDRLGSATFFTSQLDFTDSGELGAFVDDEVISHIRSVVKEHGVLSSENMFNAFNCLRSSDLIWSFVVNNYLLGKENFPFDLLYWNSDSTAMPGTVHLFYLDTFYNKNAFARGAVEIDGMRLDPKKIALPCYHVATVEDHIAPAPSAYRAAKLIGSANQKFVLTGSGHIAGVVNPPAAGKYQFWVKPGLEEPDLESWRRDAEETAGSWWPDWDAWLKSRSGKKAAAREPGARLGRIEPAPGRYVRRRADAG
ncbi:MAG: PHA/PHB synthase family protein [Paracoccaceae bacterium]